MAKLVLGNAKIDNFRVFEPRIVGHNENVLRLDVTMNDALAVSGVQSAGYWDDEFNRVHSGKPSKTSQSSAQVFTAKQLHDDEGLAALHVAEVEDLNDVDVGDARGRASLMKQPALRFGVLNQAPTKDFERNSDLKNEIGGNPNLSHPALSNEVVETVLIG